MIKAVPALSKNKKRNNIMYKASKFAIIKEINNEILLFSTLTTSVIVLNKETFSGIFEQNNFSLYNDEVNELLNASLLIPDSFDENKYLADTRTNAMKQLNEKKPSYYLITPTMNCNARCYYCFENGAHHEDMTLETAKDVVNFIIQNKPEETVTIQWFGGEPLLSVDIISFISDQLKLNNIPFNSKITTNGYLLDEKTSSIAKKEWRTEVIQITVDNVGEKYNKIKNYKEPEVDPFYLVVKNIHYAAKTDIHIRLRVNINPVDVEQAKGTISYLKKEFGQYKNIFVYFAPIDSSSDCIPSIADSFEDMQKHPIITLLDFEENYSSLGFSPPTSILDDEAVRVFTKNYLYPAPMSCGGVCSNSLTIDSLGDFYVCHRLLGQGSAFSSGNVRSGFMENQISDYYRSTKPCYLECDTCNLLPVCQGGCKFKAWKFKNKQNTACTPIKGVADIMLLRSLEELGVEL
jgi:radical SAM protein with 4Fe4S-binding SPASM domain